MANLDDLICIFYHLLSRHLCLGVMLHYCFFPLSFCAVVSLHIFMPFIHLFDYYVSVVVFGCLHWKNLIKSDYKSWFKTTATLPTLRAWRDARGT